MDAESIQRLSSAVRDVPDFPQPGILFKDISPVLGDAEHFRFAIAALAEPFRQSSVQKVVGIDARGFIFAAAVALELDAGLVLIRKRGKLPWETHSLSYALEYGEAEVEIHTDSIDPGEHVLLVDDLLATGGTAAAAQALIDKVGGNLIATSFLIELEALAGRERLLPGAPVVSILKY